MDFNYLSNITLSILSGSKVTIMLFFTVLFLSLPLGLAMMFLAKSKHKTISFLIRAFVFTMRGTPLLLQLFFIYFGLPYLPVVGKYCTMSGTSAAVLGFTLNYAAYFSEIFRGGLMSIDKGQFEASKVLGLTKMQTLHKVIIPQMIRIAMPSITNEAVNLVKDTALVFSISVAETLKMAKNVVMRNGDPLGFVIAFFIYLLINTVVQIAFTNIEKQCNKIYI